MKNFLIVAVVALTSSTLSAGEPPTTGQQLQQGFFRAVESGKAQSVLQMMHPALVKQIDSPVLQTLIKKINRDLGRSSMIEQTTVSSVNDGDQHVVETTAEVVCEKGVITVSLKAVNGIIVRFDVASEKIVGWLDQPSSNTQYEQQASDFVRTMLRGKSDKAFDMMHAALQKQLGRDDFNAMVQQTSATIEQEMPLHVTVKNSRMVETKGDSLPTMLIDVDLRSGELSGTCEVKIQFEGLRGHLLGFRFN